MSKLVISAREQTSGGRLTLLPCQGPVAPSCCTEGGAHPADQVASAVRSLATASAADNGAMTLEMKEIPQGSSGGAVHVGPEPREEGKGEREVISGPTAPVSI